jgi:hypothetical protein
MIPAVSLGDVHDLCSGLFVAVVASIDMNARAIQMAKAWRKTEALSSARGNQAVELSYPIGIEGLPCPAKGIIVELFGSHTG